VSTIQTHRRQLLLPAVAALLLVTLAGAPSAASFASPVQPNGATCSRYGRAVPRLFVGALVNAGAVGAAVSRLLTTTELAVTVLACGERWLEASEDGPLRFAVEDELGAGAILSHLDGPMSPEARLARGAYLAARGDLQDLLWECGSGRELRHKGLGADVRHAARLDLYEAVPVMQGECLARLG
jgi:2-phosphosulfolactate phosphatase